jgi:diaminohydroxyphosphoribosylaminopyrimidine deaminase/5-amino-6-(5-phosphoribosylamino)uracil reductase
MNDVFFMKMALDLAKKGLGLTSPNPMVGALIVKDGKVVGKGYHRAFGEAHAEINAIEDAGAQAIDAILYVTLEPCNHSGLTGPCTEKILTAGINRVVAAMKDPNPDVKGGGLDYLKTQGIQVVSGICEGQAAKLNEAFIKYVQTQCPFVIVKCAATLDGRIATSTGDSKWVSGKESRAFVHRLRHEIDAIMVGVDTVKTDNPSLTARLNDSKGKDPQRIILDTHLSIPGNAKVLRLDSDSDTVIVTGPSVQKEKKAAIEKNGVQFYQSPLKDGLIDLDFLMKQLKAGIVDKVIFFFAPKILGGDDGVPICSGSGPTEMRDCIPVKDISVRRYGDDVMIEGYIDKG